MEKWLLEQGFVPYSALFPQTDKGLLELSLPKKIGKARAGTYLLVESYCIQKDCDCRQVILLVINEKGKLAAAIDFPLDIDKPFVVPALNSSAKQTAGAEGLLEVFIDVFNEDPDWFKGMCRRYRAVRKKIGGHSYQGAPFPKHRPVGRDDDEALADPELPVMLELLDTYRHRGAEDYADHRGRQQQLRAALYQYGPAAEELAEILIEQFFAEDDDGVDAALRLLADVLELLRTDLERQRPDAAEQMQVWQMALADQIFSADAGVDLGAEVTRVLLDSRVEILPELHEANSKRMLAGLEAPELADVSPEQGLAELFAQLDELEVDSPFELVDVLLQMLAIGEADIQITLCTQLFYADSQLAREAAELMLFHPHAKVRAGVAEFLAQADGGAFTPESLRRLIVSRNWFPEALRKQIDQAIANARRARVDCAPLVPQGKKTVYASAIDGAGAQSLQIVLPQGKGYLSCSIMLKRGGGVADAFLIPFPNKRELNRFLKMMKQETGATEVTADFPERRLCQALADGAAAGKVPGHWLVAIAEQLGCDQWKAVPLDLRQELALLREGLAAKEHKLLLDPARQAAHRQSAAWPDKKTFARSWFEDDVEVDHILEPLLHSAAGNDPMTPVFELLDKLLEPRREIWLERLVLTTGWLKAAKRPPVPWIQMLHVAEAVADKTVPLRDIPLLVAIAKYSVGAFMRREVEAGELF